MKRHGHIPSGCMMAVMLVSSVTFAQDAVHSDPRAAPLGLNPALAGAVYDLQATLVQRTQQNPIGDPFRTLAAGVHGCVKHGKDQGTTAGGRLGAGIQFRSDRTTALNTTQVALDMAYHVPMTRNSSVGAGLQFGFLQLLQGGPDGRWGSQYDGLQYDPSLPSGEAAVDAKHTAIDLGGGVVYVLQWGDPRNAIKNRFTTGFSGQHLGRPRLFKDPAQDRMSIRWTGFGQARLLLGKPTNYLAPAAYFFAQGPRNMVLAGGAFGHVFGAERSFQNEAIQVKVELGASWRSDGAVVVRMAVRWSAFSVALTYDVPTAGTMALKSATEVALGYATELQER